MKRYPAYDPPEYIDWRPDAAVMAEFRACLTADAARAAILASVDAGQHLALYAGLLRFRLHDIALKRWVKQGVISKAWLGTGEEAATVGAVHALEPGDQTGPMIRNAGACHELGMPVARMLEAYLGTYDTITRGRDLHTGDPARGVIPPISMVASLVPVFTGIALGFLRQGKRNVALTWVGDGATRTVEFHEGVNLASSLRVPAIFVIQNNQVALGTTLAAGVGGDLHALHRAYGARGLSSDGNNVLDVYAATRIAADLCRRGEGPVFLEAETFRMGGHATHDEAEARATFSAELFAHWGRRDPIGMYETWLIESGPRLAQASGSDLDHVARADDRSAMSTGADQGASRSAPGEVGASRKRKSSVASPARGTLRPGQGEASPGPPRFNPEETAEENRRVLAALEERVAAEVDKAADEALASRVSAQPPPETAGVGVYAAGCDN